HDGRWYRDDSLIGLLSVGSLFVGPGLGTVARGDTVGQRRVSSGLGTACGLVRLFGGGLIGGFSGRRGIVCRRCLAVIGLGWRLRAISRRCFVIGRCGRRLVGG